MAKIKEQLFIIVVNIGCFVEQFDTFTNHTLALKRFRACIRQLKPDVKEKHLDKAEYEKIYCFNRDDEEISINLLY